MHRGQRGAHIFAHRLRAHPPAGGRGQGLTEGVLRAHEVKAPHIE
jgi:hypothetical protein